MEAAPIIQREVPRFCSWSKVEEAVLKHGWLIDQLTPEGENDMARGRGGSRPTHYIAVTAQVGKGKYEKGPYIGMWEGEGRNAPLFRGNAKGKYLDELYDFIKEYGDESIGFAVFESREDSRGGGRGRDRDDRDNDRDNDRDSDRGSRRSSRDRDDEGIATNAAAEAAATMTRAAGAAARKMTMTRGVAVVGKTRERTGGIK